MFEDIKNKTALVTGASRGIGRAIAENLLQWGAHVYGVARSSDEMKHIATQKYSGGFTPLIADLANQEEIQKIAAKVHRLDILIHNAAFFECLMIDQLSEEKWNQHIMLNLTTPFLLTRALWKKLKKPSGSESSIVFISSLAGVQNKEKFAGTSAYVSSKMGLTGLSEVVALEGKEFNIRSNAISPGSVDTKMLKDAFPEMQADFTPANIAHAVLYYASEVSAPVSGTNMLIHK